jgi:hypothetical protein
MYKEIRIAFNAVLVAAAVCASQDTVYLAVGNRFQDSCNAHAFMSTVFIVDSGVHRLQDVLPWRGQTFTGRPGAVMSGARLLENWKRRGNVWAHGDQMQRGRDFGVCEPGYPACMYPEDLFVDDSTYTRVMSLAEVKPGHWYFSYDSDSVYIGDNPSGHVVEIGVSERAFGGTGSHITIKGLVIEKYACPSQEAAITNQWPGDFWTVENCEVRLNHSGGIQLRGRNGIVRGNNVHHNGQKGIGIVDGGDCSLIENNEIAYNNWKKMFAFGWEGGGTKFAHARNLIIRNNFAHHNCGPGLWSDINCNNLVYEYNRCEYNSAEGIFHETCDSAIIRCNVLRFNATLLGSNLQVANSTNTQVFGNVIEVHADYGDGLIVVQKQRVDSALGRALLVRNNHIHHNHIIYKGDKGVSGGYCEYQCDDFWTNGHTLFDYNSYHVGDLSQKHWFWKNMQQSWTDVQANGSEINSTADSDTSSMDSIPQCKGIAEIARKKALSASQSRSRCSISYDRAGRAIRIRVPDINHDDIAVSVYTMRGRKALPEHVMSAHKNEMAIRTNGIAPGAYRIRLVSRNREMRQRLTVIK